MTKGFILQGVEKDRRDERFNVFHFKETEELIQFVNDYKKSKSKFK